MQAIDGNNGLEVRVHRQRLEAVRRSAAHLGLLVLGLVLCACGGGSESSEVATASLGDARQAPATWVPGQVPGVNLKLNTP